MTQSFSSWTEYDNWLVQNYEKYAVTSLNEEAGNVTAEYVEKAEWERMQKEQESKNNQK